LLAAILGAILWLVFTIRDKVVPLLETLTATAKRLQGTTEFMTERAVTPVVSMTSTLAGIRAATKAVTGGKRRVTQRRRKEE
jgi:K+ transporter